MSRAAESQAKSTYNDQKAAYQKYGGQADSLYSKLLPTYTGMATNPQGFDQATLNNMTTSGMQSTGGSVAGVVGQGNLTAARTGNAGGYQYALRDAAHEGMKENSDNALQTQMANSDFKKEQQAEGLNGLNGLYSSDLSSSMGELNARNESTDALTKAGQSGWFQNMLGLGNMVANVGKAFKGGKKGGD